LVEKSLRYFLNQSEVKQNLSRGSTRTRFPALNAKFLYLPRFLIGFFCFVPVVIGLGNYFGFGFTTLIGIDSITSWSMTS